ncbi:50S ribosomal protein L25 [Paenibacillus sp. YN15]|uniref:50S ribosomal protein L25 n=1 Tax=Paenibacillus sp. YN15 TaxID=1742774 RepID=UPI000DCC3C2E|nr:50S ribosomal protein L25 [Paenibacillus sp. YN15]RAU95968.1 50S ribosomal protein L25 [Paenibacillus sp. YN15]
MAVSLLAQTRGNLTKSGVKKLRSSGSVPGVVYGKSTNTTLVKVDNRELNALLKAHARGIIELELDAAGKQTVMIQDVQRDPLNSNLLHIDFHQINMNEPVRTEVALDFTGESKGEEEGGLLQIQLHQVEVRCLPGLIPASIAVDVTRLGMGDTITAGELQMPAGVELKTHRDEVVVTILAPQKEVEEAPAESAVKDAAPAKTTPSAEPVT